MTIVGKLLRSVRRESEAYVDDRSLSTWYGPTSTMDEMFVKDSGSSVEYSDDTMRSDLDTDVSVLAPGVVILPIAIYK